MSKKNAASTATATPAPVATVEAQVAAPVQKKGNSTIASPVAQTWTICLNLVAAALAAGQPVPARKTLVAAAQAAGVSYYTSRTQVQAYLKESKLGTVMPAKLPRGVALITAPAAE